jgi:hypothetical protein
MRSPRTRAVLRALLRAGMVALFLFAPTLTASVLLCLRLGAALTDCGVDRSAPGWADERHYRLEIEGFAAAGLRTGFYCPDEKQAPAAWCRFGAHGPGFPVLYGALARPIGCPPAAGPLIHAGLLAGASALWLWRVRPSTPQLATATLLMLTYWPLVLFLPTHMQEGFHAAAAVALAAMVPRGRQCSAVPFLLAIVLVSGVRVSWALVLLAWVLAGRARLSILFYYL